LVWGWSLGDDLGGGGAGEDRGGCWGCCGGAPVGLRGEGRRLGLLLRGEDLGGGPVADAGWRCWIG